MIKIQEKSVNQNEGWKTGAHGNYVGDIIIADIKPKNRIESIDLLRGIVMIIMAIDHVRNYFHFDAFLYSPVDLSQTSAGLFITRWITHLCAPTFIFLAGVSTYFVAQRKTINDTSSFNTDDLKQFADFLGRAKAYRDGGEVPLKATRAAAKPKAAKTPKADPPEMARRARDLYGRAADPSVTPAMIEDLVAALAGLSKAELVTVAEGLDLAGMVKKSKPVIVQEIRQPDHPPEGGDPAGRDRRP